MTKARLTDVAVRNLSVETGQERVFDEALANFGIVVGKRTKSWFIVKGADRKYQTIGQYPQMGLKTAREEAKRLLAHNGPEKPSTRLPDAVEGFLEDCRKRLRPKSIKYYETVLKKAPDIALADVNRRTVTVETLNEIRAYKALMNWCLDEDLLEKNPFKRLSAAPKERERVLTDEELQKVWHYEHSDERYSIILRLLILSGQRLNEIGKLDQAWVDYDNLTITFPAEVTKNGLTHTLPIGERTAALLRTHRPFQGWGKAKKRLDDTLQLPHFTPHDLRRTMSTNLARLQVPQTVAEKILNHITGSLSGVAGIYNRYHYQPEMREAYLKHEDFIAKLVGL